MAMRESPDYGGPREGASRGDRDLADVRLDGTEQREVEATNGDRDREQDHEGHRDAGEDNEEMVVEGEDAVIY